MSPKKTISKRINHFTSPEVDPKKWKPTALKKKKASDILLVFNKKYGDVGTALNHNNPLELLVATVLSAQCTDDRVNIVTKDFFTDCPDLDAFLRLSEKRIARYIKSINFFPTKARNLYKLFRKIESDFSGKVPKLREDLESLPGVGRKTANVVMSNAFGVPALAVDTHVHRVANRLGIASTNLPEQTEIQLVKIIPEEKWTLAHHHFIYHGRQVCKAMSPQCLACEVTTHCSSFKKFKSVILKKNKK